MIRRGGHSSGPHQRIWIAVALYAIGTMALIQRPRQDARSARRIYLGSLALALLFVVAPDAVAAEHHTARVWRIGWLCSAAPGGDRLPQFVNALRKRGYDESGNIRIERRNADYKYARLPEFAAELVACRRIADRRIPPGFNRSQCFVVPVSGLSQNRTPMMDMKYSFDARPEFVRRSSAIFQRSASKRSIPSDDQQSLVVSHS